MDPYVIVDCEGHRETSPTVYKCDAPRWNFELILYRCFPDRPIRIEVSDVRQTAHIVYHDTTG